MSKPCQGRWHIVGHARPRLERARKAARHLGHLAALRFGVALHKQGQDFYKAFALGLQEPPKGQTSFAARMRGIHKVLVSDTLRQVFDLVDRIVVLRQERIVVQLKRDETGGKDSVGYNTGVKGNADGAFA